MLQGRSLRMWGLVGLVVLANIILLGTLGFGLRRSGGVAQIFGRRGGAPAGGSAVRALVTQCACADAVWCGAAHHGGGALAIMLDGHKTGSSNCAGELEAFGVRAARRCGRPRRGRSRPGAARGARGWAA